MSPLNTNARAFTLEIHDPRVIVTEVLISRAFPNDKPPAPDQVHCKYNAIWDTGATNTAVTQRVVDECGLTTIGMCDVGTAGGVQSTTSHLISMALPHRLGVNGVRVNRVELKDGVDVLIGMDIISLGDFSITRSPSGLMQVSFMMPHGDPIDFVRQLDSINPGHVSRVENGDLFAKGTPVNLGTRVGRNDLCPCGSGKKYKKCCGTRSHKG
ncbi:MAG: SEC-C metal-binding domain-containing protein [Candidatus Hinthialibacter antarcticus]|nr:SEC-C metal-binding domain-containing protein [Candidatus Hinthialibacter antarcticus]